jgi:hypothetical protein
MIPSDYEPQHDADLRQRIALELLSDPSMTDEERETYISSGVLEDDIDDEITQMDGMR